MSIVVEDFLNGFGVTQDDGFGSSIPVRGRFAPSTPRNAR